MKAKAAIGFVSVVTVLAWMAFTGTPTAGAAWQQVTGGASPLNVADTRDAACTDMTTVAGDPWVSWVESNGVSDQVRVKRLDSDGATWTEPVAGSMPVTGSSFGVDGPNGCSTSIVEFNGTPFVAWSQYDSGGVRQIRVAKLNATATAWDRVGETISPTSPINHASDKHAVSPSLANIDGTPWVAWRESDGTNWETRVARLNATGTDWDEVVGGLNPINASDTLDAKEGPSLTSFAGSPVVAWTELDAAIGGKEQTRVARLNTTGTDWAELVGGARPINYDLNARAFEPNLIASGGRLYVGWSESVGSMDARVARLSIDESAWQSVPASGQTLTTIPGETSRRPRLTDFGGIPLVAWTQGTGLDFETRVARLDASTESWVEIVGGASPINDSSLVDSRRAQLTNVGGVPYVMWREFDTTNYEIRVSRLVPELLSFESSTNGGTRASLTAQVNTYGVSYPFDLLYGATSPWGSRAVVNSTPVDGPQAVGASLTGLMPATAYGWRAVGNDGKRSIVSGADQTFTTGPKLTAKLSKCRSKAKRRKRVTCVLTTNYAGSWKGTLKQGRRKLASVKKSLKSGKTKVTIKLKRRPSGKAKIVLTSSFTAEDGQSAKLRKKKLRP
jgi:hypothetical protein